ncbi:hypothetical protein [uncultured Draconibacterium sp.]|uniref:hypothetical protein n=1 Tax=uncultured Draconibacterium sp. TaxID=1573823 RepID=UPI0029C8397D|nr:hypothetical protein [uncultured Draconibacterium sp.]
MRWIFYIVCFFLLGINSGGEDVLPSQPTSRECFCAKQINQTIIISPDQFISEDLDTEYFAPGSGIVVSNELPTYFSGKGNDVDASFPSGYSFLLSAWLIDLPPPSLV